MAKSMADSRAIPRLISEARFQESVPIVMDAIILTSLFYLRVCQKMRFLIGKSTILGADGSGSWLKVWLAAEEAKKCWNQKILYAPVGG